MLESRDGTRIDRVTGALMGTFVGDALGGPWEFRSPDFFSERPMAGTERISYSLAEDSIRYSDDTQMTLALAEHLVECGEVRPPLLAKKFLDHHEPSRGYGGGMLQLFALWKQGVPYDDSVTALFPGGSYGNGAAMRVAALGAFGANLRFEHLTSQVRLAATVTHVHPSAVDGAIIQAHAVRMAVNSGVFTRDSLAALPPLVETGEVSNRLSVALELSQRRQPPTCEEVRERLGNGVSARDSVATSLFLAATSKRLEDAIGRALELGGDADTIAAMAGAIRGACSGLTGFPTRWIDRCERGPRGRDYAIDLGYRLAVAAPG
jgi:poly(ADP-ribose) glycohydrolase ARH3